MSDISRKAASFTESVIREMTRLAMAHDAVNLAQGFPDFACPPELKEAAQGGDRRRHQPVRDHLGRTRLPRGDRGEDDALLPRLAGRPRDRDHRHLRRDRGHDRGDAGDPGPRRRGHRLRALLRELRARCDPLRRRPALRHAPRAGLEVRSRRAPRAPSRPARAASSSTRRTIQPARSSRAPSSS